MAIFGFLDDFVRAAIAQHGVHIGAWIPEQGANHADLRRNVGCRHSGR